MAKIKATWDNPVNVSIMNDMARMIWEQMSKAKDEEIAKVFNDLKCTSGAIADPLFDEAIDWYVANRQK